MSKGSSSQAGFNAQNWAALSLFVQYSAYSSFKQIDLEQPQLADFVLVFETKRIICESKKYKVSYADVREILDTIPSVNANDEILIICTGTSPNLKEELEYARYFPRAQEKLIKRHKFTAKHLELVPKVKLWIVDKNMNESVVRNLLGERFQAWLPDDELDDLMSSLLVKNIYERSSVGGSYTKAEFDAELAQRRESLKRKDDYKYSERSAKEIISKLLDELNDPGSRLQSDNRLKAVIADPKLHYFALQEITKVQNLNLALWNNFWLATFSSYYAREVLRIFEANLTTKEAAHYIVAFITSNLPRLRFRYGQEHEFKTTADILMKAVKLSDDLLDEVFNLLRALYQYATETPLFSEGRSKPGDEWLLGELAGYIQTLYNLGDKNLKTTIVDYIYQSFSIVDEISGTWHHTPFKFFEVISDNLLTELSEFKAFLEQVRLQYCEQCKKFNLKYHGWEIIGGGVSNFAGDYKAHDKAFIDIIIKPYIMKLTVEQRWQLADEYLVLKAEEVSEIRPDFMNRAFIPFLLEEYSVGSEKAFQVLTEFIKMRRGIPHKAELIFYYVRDSQVLNLEKKWHLLDVVIKEYGFPISVFMDQVLWQLLEQEHEQAIEMFSQLLANPDYMKGQILFNTTVIESIKRVIDNPATFERGVELLQSFLLSEYFTLSLDTFHAYPARKLILTILQKNLDKGLSLLKSLIAGQPSVNQQIVFGTVLRETPEDLLSPVFTQLVKPELQSYKDATMLVEKYTSTEARENFIWFAEKLAKQHRFDEALFIAEFFLSDPSPLKNGKYDQEIIEGKRDLSISTVRGCIAWALMPVIAADGHPYLGRVFGITKTLCTDESLYGRQQSLMLLELLADNRHKTMPGSKEWFIEYAIAKEIEDFAFSLLEDKSNYHNAIMQHLAGVFNKIRTLSDEQAVHVINTFSDFGDTETLKEIDTLIIFMAEFRKGAFKHWPTSRGEIPPYDPKPVQKILRSILENGPDEHRQSLVWHIAKLPEEAPKSNREFERFFNISNKYLGHAIKKYDHLLFSSVYQFVQRYIDRKFTQCYKLWRRSLDVERAAIIGESKKDQNPGTYNWWPYHYNGAILLKVLANLGTEQFLKDLEFLVDYPEEAVFPSDFNKVLSELERMKTHTSDIKRIYEKLIARSYLFNGSYENWLQNNV
jgi:hypothetical protein